MTVLDFFRWAMPIALAVLALVFVICRWWFAVDWNTFSRAVHWEHSNPTVADPSRGRSTTAGWLMVISMVTLLVLHAQIERLLGMAADTMLLAAVLGAGAVALMLSGSGAKDLIWRRVDWATLAFFLLLFVVVGALQATGVTGVAAHMLMRGTGGRPAAIVLAVGWSTGFLSAILANMLAVAAFIPVVADLKAHGARLPNRDLLAHAVWRFVHGQHDQHRIDLQHHRLRNGRQKRTWNDLLHPMAQDRPDHQPRFDGAGDASAGD